MTTALIWTRSPPTERGWYWFLEDGDDAYEMMYVAPLLTRVMVSNPTKHMLEIEPHCFNVNDLHGQWQGPLYPDPDILVSDITETTSPG